MQTGDVTDNIQQKDSTWCLIRKSRDCLSTCERYLPPGYRKIKINWLEQAPLRCPPYMHYCEHKNDVITFVLPKREISYTSTHKHQKLILLTLMFRGGHEVYRKTWHFYTYLLNQVLHRRYFVIFLKLGLLPWALYLMLYFQHNKTVFTILVWHRLPMFALTTRLQNMG